MRRVMLAGTSSALAMALLAPPAAAVPQPEPAPGGAGAYAVVGIGGPTMMILRAGCRTDYIAGAVFDAVAGEEYWVVINAEDSTGRDIDGGIREGVAETTGRMTVTAPLLLCGPNHDAGYGLLKVGLLVGDRIDEDLRKRVRIVYADRVRQGRTGIVTGVRRGERVRLAGTWDRGAGFGRGLTTAVREAVRVRLFFKPRGGTWRAVTSVRIDSQGRWRKRVKITRTGTWQARILASSKLLPARSKTRTIRVR